ncbi:MAG TPA: DUF3667 domain-containing protein [Casimicrobiaceae bacterium]|nr:DUF3667 domain-containing protein [Casimicrobiaceae bacterium]
MKRTLVSDRAPDSARPAPAGSAHLCANCGANAPDRYCPECGQDTRERLPTFVQFMREATGRYLAFDGKLWKTLIPLLFRPGFLTRAYLAGKRKRFIGPARLFLISSLALFAALRFTAESISIVSLSPSVKVESGESAKAAKAAAKAGAKELQDEGILIDEDLNLSVSDLSESAGGPLKTRIDRFNRLPREQKVEQIIAGITRYGPYAMFVLLPAFAVLLKVAYLGRSSRYPGRPRLYGEHLVFAAHNHSFLFAVGILLFAVPITVVRQILAVWILVYLAWSTRTVYGGSWFGVAVRGFALAVAYFAFFVTANVGLLAAAILLR